MTVSLIKVCHICWKPSNIMAATMQGVTQITQYTNAYISLYAHASCWLFNQDVQGYITLVVVAICKI